MPVLYLTHGGGPLPLLGDAAHAELIEFLQTIPEHFQRPEAILIVSAHWEERYPTLTGSEHPPLIYDYGGFPPESYSIQYPAPGQPALANEVLQLLADNGVEARVDAERGFDHGMFVPLKLMYPMADIPCVQLSLMESLDPQDHVRMGEALMPLLQKNILVVGSGSSFHNMRALITGGSGHAQSVEFNDWLIETCTSTDLEPAKRKQRLIDWESAPQARYCHPREEHLLPLHVCIGCAAGHMAQTVFNGNVIGMAMSGFLWQQQ